MPGLSIKDIFEPQGTSEAVAPTLGSKPTMRHYANYDSGNSSSEHPLLNQKRSGRRRCDGVHAIRTSSHRAPPRLTSQTYEP